MTNLEILNQFNDSVANYSKNIENEIANLERMKKEMGLRVQKAKMLMEALQPVLSKLHLSVKDMFVNLPNKEKALIRGNIRLTLKAEEGFKFILFRGYTARGEGKNRNRLDSKADSIEKKVEKALEEIDPYINCEVNPYSLEIKNEGETGSVLMEIYYNIF